MFRWRKKQPVVEPVQQYKYAQPHQVHVALDVDRTGTLWYGKTPLINGFIAAVDLCGCQDHCDCPQFQTTQPPEIRGKVIGTFWQYPQHVALNNIQVPADASHRQRQRVLRRYHITDNDAATSRACLSKFSMEYDGHRLRTPHA